MGTELTKWNGGKPVKASAAVENNRRVTETALALLRSAVPERRRGEDEDHEIGPYGRSHNVLTASPAPASCEVVDLPRVCAVHDMPYAARYVRSKHGSFRHAQTIKVTESLYLGQYADNRNTSVVPCEDLAEETCPWCGACGRGAVLCGVCRKEVCYGRTTGNFFRCRESCKGSGNMVPQARRNEGLVPSCRRDASQSVAVRNR